MHPPQRGVRVNGKGSAGDERLRPVRSDEPGFQFPPAQYKPRHPAYDRTSVQPPSASGRKAWSAGVVATSFSPSQAPLRSAGALASNR